MLLPCEKHTLCSLHAGATIGFETLTESVDESEGSASLNVTVKGDQLLATNAVVVVRFYTSPGTAQSGQ